MESKWFVYAILCNNGSIYIGHTNNLIQRWRRHKKGSGAQWTKKHQPLNLFYFEELDSQENALLRERELKKTTGRRMLRRLLERIGQQIGSQAGEPAEKLLERIKNERLRQENERRISKDRGKINGKRTRRMVETG